MPNRTAPVIAAAFITLTTTGIPREAVVTGVTLAAQDQSSPSTPAWAFPIEVLSAEVDPAGTVTFLLHNTGTKAIIAWDVDISVGSGPETRRSGYGVDAFRSFVGLVEGPISYILPGGALWVTTRVPVGGTQRAPVIVTPRSAVLDDNSSVGDSRSIQYVFGRRAIDLDGWRDIVTQLAQLRDRGGVDVAKLETVLAQLTAARDRSGVNIPLLSTSANLAIGIADVRAGRAEALSILNRLLTEAQRNVAITTAHSRR